MIKREEIREPTSCLNRAEDDEPLFVLRAKDICGAETVMFWCSLRLSAGKNQDGDDQIVDALRIVKAMTEWRHTRPT